MANSYFKFKKFTVEQGIAGMKVGTDGVLIGAWASCEGVQSILDVGTGTGLIALMCAQKNNGATIDALEIEEKACEQAIQNINNSAWNDRINVVEGSFQEYSESMQKKYDLIISNPPFFQNSLKNECHQKSLARHTASLSFEELIYGVVRILRKEGCFSVILPYDVKDEFVHIAKSHLLHLNRVLGVKPTPTKPEKRILMEFGFFKKELDEDVMIIEEFGRHGYSQYYKELTKEFYLKF